MAETAKRYSPAITVLLVTLNYVFTIAAPPIIALYVAARVEPRYMYTAIAASMIAWLAYVTIDNCELKTGRPDEKFSKDHWVFSRLRAYMKLKLHRTDAVQSQLKDDQAIFAFFPHGVNSDFRVLMAGPMYDAFPRVHSRGAPRTLAASILFKIPGVRTVTLKTGCVDAGRATANRCLRQGLSLFLCPGGQDEQLETICGRERVYLKSRKGFVRLAMIHNVPLVPAYCFGSSDLYRTYGAFYGVRRWLVRNLRIALPLYSGDWGFFCYPTPKGFPLQVPQDIVFGDAWTPPHVEEPTRDDVSKAHAVFVAKLTRLFDENKAEYGYPNRKLEII